MPDDQIEQDPSRLWADAYQGEVLGEVLFGGLAERATDPEQRAKLGAICHLERSTRALLRPVLEREGLPVDDDPEVTAQATQIVDGAAAMPWPDLLATFEPSTARFVAIYEGLRDRVDGGDREVVDALLAHERALCEFARRELAGETDRSLEPIFDLPHVPLLPG